MVHALQMVASTAAPAIRAGAASRASMRQAATVARASMVVRAPPVARAIPANARADGAVRAVPQRIRQRWTPLSSLARLEWHPRSMAFTPRSSKPATASQHSKRVGPTATRSTSPLVIQRSGLSLLTCRLVHMLRRSCHLTIVDRAHRPRMAARASGKSFHPPALRHRTPTSWSENSLPCDKGALEVHVIFINYSLL
jgi:hypothetical protein